MKAVQGLEIWATVALVPSASRALVHLVSGPTNAFSAAWNRDICEGGIFTNVAAEAASAPRPRRTKAAARTVNNLKRTVYLLVSTWSPSTHGSDKHESGA